MQNLPNLISLMRLLLVPLTVWLILSEAYGWAFTTFLVAGISDGVDGYLARRFDWRTRLGAYLDPLADKALVVSVFVTLGFLKLIPAWLVITVVSRDVLIIGAVLLSRLMDHPVRVAPADGEQGQYRGADRLPGGGAGRCRRGPAAGQACGLRQHPRRPVDGAVGCRLSDGLAPPHGGRAE